MSNNVVTEDVAGRVSLLVGWLLAAFVAGFAIYLVAVFIAYLHPPLLPSLKEALDKKQAFNIGLPIAGLGAFGVVAMLQLLFPPEKTAGSIKIIFFGLDFTGPAGPITLWIACFLSIVGSMKWLS